MPRDWMARARAQIGLRELAGKEDNAAIMAFYRDAGHPGVAHDETPWCAAFVGAMLHRSGIKPSGSLMARSYLRWGVPLASPRQGCIVVLRRGGDPALGHVGFYVQRRGSKIAILGGNQRDSVSIADYPVSQVLGYRWPSEAASSRQAAEARFEQALAHVLEVEGGYTNDKHDPGGPTNKGITLAVYARHRGEAVSQATVAELTRQLKQIPDRTVRAIYRKLYWRAASCPDLPQPLAFMHFDCAVNQGVGRAIRFLQQVIGADVDGEVGPETLGKARQASRKSALEEYADLRRKHYQGLSTFWRFGRGWMRRLDLTLERALALLEASREQPAARQESETMTFNQQSTDSSKWWGQSLTIWGAIVTAMSTVLPALGPVIGLDITADLVQLLGQQIVQLVEAAGGVLGTAMIIFGRVRAGSQLTRRRITVTL